MADRRSPDEEAALSARLKRLGERIHEAGERRQHDAAELREDEMRRQGESSNLAKALRLSSEFVAGIVLGGLIGWGIDHFAGSSPWGLIVFLLLGFAAGTLNAMRSAGLVAERGTGKKD
ncbi:MAG TPA: AtpZ/AtpI family protein [Xanthobacteraceae bacterium]|nr:AtpZ/AtpI family protein [Xanthobacteraceae bacterium]